MPVQNTQGNFSVGRDCTLVLIDSVLGTVQLDNVTGFQSAQVTAMVKSDRLDGVQLQGEIPKGWTGSFQLDRGSSAIDDLFASREALWYDQGQLTAAQVFQYVKEADGSRSTYQFDNVALKLDDAGTFAGDQTVKQRISMTANRRKKVS